MNDGYFDIDSGVVSSELTPPNHTFEPDPR